MSILDSLIHDLRGMSLHQLVDVARFVRHLSETAEGTKAVEGERRAEVLWETPGHVDEKEREALIYEQALAASARRGETRC